MQIYFLYVQCSFFLLETFAFLSSLFWHDLSIPPSSLLLHHTCSICTWLSLTPFTHSYSPPGLLCFPPSSTSLPVSHFLFLLTSSCSSPAALFSVPICVYWRSEASSLFSKTVYPFLKTLDLSIDNLLKFSRDDTFYAQINKRGWCIHFWKHRNLH